MKVPGSNAAVTVLLEYLDPAISSCLVFAL